MNIGLVIAQLKSVATIFSSNVAGAAEYEKAVEDQTWLPFPAAYVIPLDTEAGPNESLNGLYQITIERIGVIVAMDNSPDRRGQTAVATIDQVQAALFSALLNWRPDSSIDNPASAGDVELDHESRGFRLDHANLVGWDRARLFYQWDFALDVTISDADGWQPPQPAFLEIQGTLTTLLPITFTGDVVKGQATIFNVSDVANLAQGMILTAAAVLGAGTTTINAPPGASSLALSQPAIATMAGVTFTATLPAPGAPQPSFDIQLPQS